MSGSVYGEIFKVSTWGESHGVGLGVCVDGCPAGLCISEEDIQKQLDRRKPGQSEFTTARSEGDKVKIFSGLFNGQTTGAPIAMSIENTDQHSKDYGELERVYRPGHADYTFDAKYGIRDHRGGGRSSGRETIGRVAAGAVAKKVLEELGIAVMAYTTQIGDIKIDSSIPNLDGSLKDLFCMPDKDASERAAEYVRGLRQRGDSAGGIIECRIKGVKPGIGEPVFDKLDAELAKAVFSIGAVKGFEIGRGFESAKMSGSNNNDEFVSARQGITKLTNNSGGILGGMSDGDEIVFRAAVKPTPSISSRQKTVDMDGEGREIVIKGRHDPIIVPRAVVVVESMASIALVDLILKDMSSKMDYVREYYRKK